MERTKTSWKWPPLRNPGAKGCDDVWLFLQYVVYVSKQGMSDPQEQAQHPDKE